MSFAVSHFFLWALVIFHSLAICALVRLLADLRRLAGKGFVSTTKASLVGRQAPRFSAIDLRSQQIVSTSSFQRERRILMFISPDCIVCRRILSELSSTSTDWDRLLIYCHGTRRACQVDLRSLPASVQILGRSETDVASLYGLMRLPAVVALDETLRVEGVHYPTQYSELKSFLSEETQLPHPSALENVN